MRLPGKKYLVGGMVRDELMGVEANSDRDWVITGATEAEMLDAGFRRIGRSFPVFLHPRTKEEYALARREQKTAPGHAGFEFTTGPEVSIEQDLRRRDLTVNAMARGDDGSLIDPYGGRRDLEAKILRHVSDAFAEDPLRVFQSGAFCVVVPGLQCCGGNKRIDAQHAAGIDCVSAGTSLAGIREVDVVACTVSFF